MATEFTASAPGKLVIAGEYAVLDGAPAISAAVNRRAVATVRPAGAGEVHILNTGASFRYALNAVGLPVWTNDPGKFGSVLAATLRTLANDQALPVGQQPWQVQLDSIDFHIAASDGVLRKLGIGSSAAISVALTAALQSCMGREPDFALCLAAHREFQQGAGSGIDVATAWHGGVILMQPLAGAKPQIEQLQWPAGFYVRPVWTGVPAATTQMLQRLAAYRREAAQDYVRRLQQFVTLLQRIREYWRAADAAALTDALNHYGVLLAELDAAAAIGIWSEPHRALETLAQSMQLGYKPSGAGGGDFGLVYSADPARIDAFVREVHARIVPQTHGVEWAAPGLLINDRAVAERPGASG